jgi:iron complex transport system ATP-binding protein
VSAELLACQGIVYRREGRRVLDGVALQLHAGEIVALLGVNGAGKSTLLRILLGLIQPQQGKVELSGRPLAAWRRVQVARAMAYVPQIHVASFGYTVRQMVALGRVPHAGLGRELSEDDHAAIEQALQRLRIGALAGRPYTELSGGERQRVLLARALAQQARILVMDEPLNGLDYGHQLRLLALLQELAADGHAVMLTTHRPDEALHGASRALLLQHGRVVADGPPGRVIDAASMAALYDVELGQVDAAGRRFFFHQPS